MDERTPAEVFPPGEFLQEELEARDWTPQQFAAQLNVPSEVLHALLEGKQVIDADMAARLSRALGSSAAYWLNLQHAYEARSLSPWR